MATSPGLLKTSKHVAATKVAAVSQPSGFGGFFRDTATYRAVEAAVPYILQLLWEKETLFSGNGKSLAMRQWRQLRELLVADHAQYGATKRKASIEAPAGRR